MKKFGCILILLMMAIPVTARNSMWSGQLSTYVTVTKNYTADFNYLPGFEYTAAITANQSLNVEMRMNIYTHVLAGKPWKDAVTKDWYRAHVSLQTPTHEIRAGLQKLNFGSAKILRGLQWFDNLDSTDPAQYTEGVNGLLGRLFLPDNSNIWMWGLFGNTDRQNSATGNVELGGRYQIPVNDGELAFTVHHRKTLGTNLCKEPYDETRLGLDGQWDIGIGLWFEAGATQVIPDSDSNQTAWHYTVTLGTDYTVMIGNGLYLMLEQGFPAQGRSFLNVTDIDAQTAFLLTYPLNPIDSLNAIARLDWAGHNIGYLNWKSTYDDWILQLSAIYNRGWGTQVSAVFNY